MKDYFAFGSFDMTKFVSKPESAPWPEWSSFYFFASEKALAKNKKAGTGDG